MLRILWTCHNYAVLLRYFGHAYTYLYYYFLSVFSRGLSEAPEVCQRFTRGLREIYQKFTRTCTSCATNKPYLHSPSISLVYSNGHAVTVKKLPLQHLVSNIPPQWREASPSISRWIGPTCATRRSLPKGLSTSM